MTRRTGPRNVRTVTKKRHPVRVGEGEGEHEVVYPKCVRERRRSTTFRGTRRIVSGERAPLDRSGSRGCRRGSDGATVEGTPAPYNVPAPARVAGAENVRLSPTVSSPKNTSGAIRDRGERLAGSLFASKMMTSVGEVACPYETQKERRIGR